MFNEERVNVGMRYPAIRHTLRSTLEALIESAHVQRERRRSRSLEAMAVGALVSLVAGYEDCLAALPRLGFDQVDYEDGISLWLKVRPAESVPEVPLACSGQDPNPEDDGEELTSLSVAQP